MTKSIPALKKYIQPEILFFSGVVLLYIAICSPYLFDRYFFAPDADRIAMDGIFLKDFFLDLPGSLLHPYEYTTTYYAKYPALSVGYRPIFFQSMEAIVYMVLGTSYVSAKITVLCFLFTGIFFWLKLVKMTHGYSFAVCSLLLWISNPYVYSYSQQTMLEIPTLSMVITATYFIHKYFSKVSIKNAVIMGIIVGLTLWTNQKSAFVLIIIGTYPVVSGNWKKLLARESFLSYLILGIFIIPLTLMTLWLGAQNLAQSIGTNSGANRIISLKELVENLQFLYQYHFSLPLLLLISLGMIHGIITKRKACMIYLSGIFSIYIFFSYVKHDIPRYSMYWIPFFCIFASHGVFYITELFSKITQQKIKKIAYFTILVPFAFQLSLLPQVFIPTASGYEKAAAFTINHSKSPVVFFDGYANGQFIYFMGIFDEKREFVVLRGDKLISSSSISYTNRLKIHLNNKSEIAKALTDMGVQFVIVESKNLSRLDIYNQLRDMLADNSQFKLLKTIPVKSNREQLNQMNLLIYENRHWLGINSDQVIKLRLPVVGQELNVPLKRVLH